MISRAREVLPMPASLTCTFHCSAWWITLASALSLLLACPFGPKRPQRKYKVLHVARTPSGHQHIVMLPPHPLCATLRYGSSDGGHTVHNSNATLNERMKEAAARLNLAEHVAGLPGPGTVPQRLHHAVDVEAHVGRDNRWRCGVVVALWLQMDVASPSLTHAGTRHTGSTFWTQLVSFPLSIQMRHPTCPTFEDRSARDTRTVLCRQLPSHNFPLAPLSQRSIFFRLLRSDFVRSWQEPLSADALSRFSTADPNAHGKHAVQASYACRDTQPTH